MAEMAGMSASDREQAMIAAYKAGEQVTSIQKRFDVPRSSLYHILKRAGVKPSRSARRVDAASGEARLAWLAELIQHQDRLIQEAAERERKLVRENTALKTKLAKLNGTKAG
jgi:transposase